jgi:hypothetical protein
VLLQVQKTEQLFGNNGINYDPFHPMGHGSMRKVFPSSPLAPPIPGRFTAFPGFTRRARAHIHCR